LANFAKNIRAFRVENGNGEPLHFEKQTKDSWLILANKTPVIKVIYEYYGADLNAGSTYLDAEQLYVNPVNCCVFVPERINEACEIELRVHDSCKIACDLPRGKNGKILLADSFHRLADAPFIASPKLQHQQFDESDHTFHLWFMGNVSPQWQRLENDFRDFSRDQIEMMGPLPSNDFHFIFHFLPVFFYHGVEHTFSTVCALGPGSTLFTTSFYNELLGVSSHELFHAWNVKTIRPSEMHPYDYTRENYSRLGWVYEGITTYYGDQFLARSGVFDLHEFLGTLNDKLKKHFSNYGRFNQSVSEASFDTWLDGYVPGIPHRKTSIYTEGSLCAFMLDMLIRKHSNESYSLDELMRRLYAEANNDIPYSKEKILSILEQLADFDFKDFYATYIEGTEDYEPLLKDCFKRVGLELFADYPFSDAEHRLGFTLLESGGIVTVNLVAPGSPAETAGLMTGDQLIACNGIRIKGNFQALSSGEDEVTLFAFSKENLNQYRLSNTGKLHFESRKVIPVASPTEDQIKAHKNWIGKK